MEEPFELLVRMLVASYEPNPERFTRYSNIRTESLIKLIESQDFTIEELSEVFNTDSSLVK